MLALPTDGEQRARKDIAQRVPEGGQEEKAARKLALSNPKQIQNKQKTGAADS